MKVRRSLGPLVTIGALALLEVGARAEPAVSATYVEGRLLAPCCWTQTLDVHESPLSTTLRAEIEGRVQRGETAIQIEDDMANRYGERVRAIPRGEEPRAKVALASAVATLVALGAMVATLARWVRRDRETELGTDATKGGDATADATYDARLEAELHALDDPR